MLHDVVRQLGEVGEVDVLLPHLFFALPQALRQRSALNAHDKQNSAQHAGAGVVGRLSEAGQVDQHLLHQQHQRRAGARRGTPLRCAEMQAHRAHRE